MCESQCLEIKTVLLYNYKRIVLGTCDEEDTAGNM